MRDTILTEKGDIFPISNTMIFHIHESIMILTVEDKEIDNNFKLDIDSRKLLQPVRFQHPNSRLGILFIVASPPEKAELPFSSLESESFHIIYISS